MPRQPERRARVRVSRRAEFAAAHCGGTGTHGHNYDVRATVECEADHVTGFGLNIAQLKALLGDAVTARLDGRDLSEDVPELAGRPVTTERLAVLVWEWLVTRVAPARLVEVRVAEHPRLWAEYRGE